VEFHQVSVWVRVDPVDRDHAIDALQTPTVHVKLAVEVDADHARLDLR